MRRTHSIQQVVRSYLCISCGACVSATPEGTMELVYSPRVGMYIPRILCKRNVTGRGFEFEVCPGKGMPLMSMAHELYGDAPHGTLELGRYRLAVASHATDQEILANASSGGVMTAIAAYMIQEKLVDGATATRFIYSLSGPRAKSFIANNLQDLLRGQGSKYCPTSTNLLVRPCRESGGRYLFIGTPCQVAALRLAARQDSRLAETFPFTMANFCGGYRDYRDLDDLIERNGIAVRDVVFFRFRGGGQPGSMIIRANNGREIYVPYPDYGWGALVPKCKRCTFCIDATGVLADFACGDAWLKEYANKDGYAWSIILARSRMAEEIVHRMTQTGSLHIEQTLSEEQIIYSQRFNLDSKLYRQHKRMVLYGLMGVRMPHWDMALLGGHISYWQEAKILISKAIAVVKYRYRYSLGLRKHPPLCRK